MEKEKHLLRRRIRKKRISRIFIHGKTRQPLKKAGQVEDQYLDALEEKNREIEEQSDGG